MNAVLKYIGLMAAFAIYSSSTIFSKLASRCDFLSINFIGYLFCLVSVLGIYAILWQQIIKRIPLTDAYLFKGSTTIYTIIIAQCIFGETYSVKNYIGMTIIFIGILLNSRVK